MSENLRGYLYCMWNKVFSGYGKDVHKLGRTSNINNRMNSYATSYIDNCECKYVTERLFSNSEHAEKLLFFILRKYRIRKNREFFDVPFEKIVETIKRIEAISDEKIEVMYKKMCNDFLNDRIIIEIENFEDYINDEEKNIVNIDSEYFERFKFRKDVNFKNIN